MKVVQTTEFTVLGPLNESNTEDIAREVAKHTNSPAATIPEPFVDNGFYVLLGSDHTARPVHPSDFAEDYQEVDEYALDAMEAQFAVSDAAKQGEISTEEVWQAFEDYTGQAQWWDTVDEAHARKITTKGKIRMRRDIHVTGQWTYFDV